MAPIHLLPNPSPLLRQKVCIILGLLILITIWSCRLSLTTYMHPSPHMPTNHEVASPHSPFISWPLQRACNETTWVPHLTYLCDSNSGGIGNIRAYILTCLRYAIASGSTGLVLPRITTRCPTNIAQIQTGASQPFSYFFDAEHFKTLLGEACPQITVYDEIEDVEGYGEMWDDEKVEQIRPKEFGKMGQCGNCDQDRHTDRFGERFREWLSSTKTGVPTVSHPRIMRLQWGVIWDWPVYRDGPEFVATFGSLLRFRADVRVLAEKIAKTMDLKTTGAPGDSGMDGKGWMGIHLRAEKDALKFWPSTENQTVAFIQKAESRGFEYAYLACGDEGERRKFAQRASGRSEVADKFGLLEGEDLEKLKELTWD